MALAMVSCDATHEPAAPPPPSVLLYVSDTLRADSIRPYGNSAVATPALSRLAREGTRYENVYAQSSWTRPSVSSILTGLYPDAHGVERRSDDMPTALGLLSEMFQEAGYKTACITTNPNVGSFFGFDQGYDDFVEMYARRKRGRVTALEERAAADQVTERAISWLEQNPDPFFLFVLTTDPHWPYEPPPGFDRYGLDYEGDVDGKFNAKRRNLSDADRDRIRGLYYGEISFNDHAFGGLIDHLRKSGRLDNTIVAFTSDHGEEFWEHGSNGHGKTLYQEQLHVPLILRYPGVVEAGMVERSAVESVDLAPTLLSLAGLPKPDDLDGTVLGERGADALFARLAIGKSRQETLVEPPWKLIMRSSKQGMTLLSLFDLSTDPGEHTDLADLHPERVSAMERTLTERRVRVAANRSKRLNIEAGEAVGGAGREVPEQIRDALEALGYVNGGEE